MVLDGISELGLKPREIDSNMYEKVYFLFLYGYILRLLRVIIWVCYLLILKFAEWKLHSYIGLFLRWEGGDKGKLMYMPNSCHVHSEGEEDGFH